MTYREKIQMEHPDMASPIFAGGVHGCPGMYVPGAPLAETCNPKDCASCWNTEMPSTIKDSGERREFSTGAVRDIQEGKGRCDLMPLDVVADHMPSPILEQIADFMRLNEPQFLWNAMDLFQYEAFHMGLVDTKQRMANTLLEVSKHFEEGAKKYGEYNWQKGIPVRSYIDSAVRHYLKWLRGDDDEPHDRAFCWNILCAIWTCRHKPELNDYRKE